MRAGRLDRRITLQRRATSYDSAGEPIDSWTELAANRAASISPVGGDERFGGDKWAAREQTEFRVRWSSDIADLSPLDRIVYPSSDASSSPAPVRSVYEIAAVHEIGRREGLQIIAAREPDVS